MNWDAIGAVGQMLGALGVIISLAYLSIQLKQNGLATQHASQNMFIGEYNRYIEHLYSNQQLLELIQRASYDTKELSFAENEQIHLLLVQHHLLNWNIFLQVEAKQFNPRMAETFFRYFAALLKAPRYNAWWRTYRATLGGAYARYMDSLIADPHQPSIEQIQPWWGTARSSPAGVA